MVQTLKSLSHWSISETPFYPIGLHCTSPPATPKTFNLTLCIKFVSKKYLHFYDQQKYGKLSQYCPPERSLFGSLTVGGNCNHNPMCWCPEGTILTIHPRNSSFHTAVIRHCGYIVLRAIVYAPVPLGIMLRTHNLCGVHDFTLHYTLPNWSLSWQSLRINDWFVCLVLVWLLCLRYLLGTNNTADNWACVFIYVFFYTHISEEHTIYDTCNIYVILWYTDMNTIQVNGLNVWGNTVIDW